MLETQHLRNIFGILTRAPVFPWPLSPPKPSLQTLCDVPVQGSESVAHQRHLPLPALIYQTFDKSGQVEVDAFGGGPGPKFWAQGPKFGPMGPDLGPGAQIWGAPGPGPFFSARIFFGNKGPDPHQADFQEKVAPPGLQTLPRGCASKN